MQLTGKLSRADDIILEDFSGSIVRYLGTLDDRCSLFESDIEIIEEIVKDKIYKIRITDYGDRIFVMKKIPIITTMLAGDFDNYIHAEDYDYNLIKELNKTVIPGDPIFLPTYAKICKTKVPKYVKISEGLTSYIPKNSYLCDYFTGYNEYIISMLCSELYNRGTCVNFISMFDFVTCNDKNNSYQYIFMEHSGRSLNYFLTDELLRIDSFPSLIIQLLFTIACYSETYKINHNDLHPGNILLEQISDAHKYHDDTFIDSDGQLKYLRYSLKFGDDIMSFFIPPIFDVNGNSYILKIADFGFAVKWNVPIVGPMQVIDDKLDVKLPKTYSPFYDVLYSLFNIYDTDLADQSDFMRQIFKEAVPLLSKSLEHKDLLKIFHHNRRPKVPVTCGKSAIQLLSSKVLKKYQKHHENHITVGELEL